MVNQKKSITNPTQELEFLGFQVGSVSINLSIPLEKLRNIRQDARRMLDCPQVTVREVQVYCSKLCRESCSYTESHPFSSITLSSSPNVNEFCLSPELHTGGGEQEIQESSDNDRSLQLQADLTWWVLLEQSNLGTPVCPPCPTVTVDSDASNKGWRAVFNGQMQTGGQWSPGEATYHINYLELLAAFLAIKAFRKTRQGVTVSLHIDNITAHRQHHSSTLYQ